MTLSVYPIPAFNDNYIWAIHDGTQCVVVDPGDAAPVRDFLQQHSLGLSTILITHHHPDHTGGLKALLTDYDAEAFGPQGDHIAGIQHPLGENDEIVVLGSLRMRVLEVPGHTLDHIAFYAAPTPTTPDAATAQPMLFCGDTLFAAGCGRIFEGNAEMMYQSLQKLARLPKDTLIYCAHEYTLNNLRFAAMAEPGNNAITERVKNESAKRQRDEPTLPSNIDLELRTNPFLRCHIESLGNHLAANNKLSVSHSDQQVFAALRNWKDSV
ncbi:hydroxyacylglutathione hydrolase [Pseudohongiella spirulinae]|uniref:Hydroxyacylglutathione hydrolase n=1 Tax=Pseudohongiella spirulinae TaxID=1249552 RepID=A0A0S2KCS4_9GAMM|nr:hydroxyacylglutathione hydrolase [Pseudohongiella spirulinae]ALO46107.1 hydroxyacylglutathione hydrolase [Pseudohongiella spirulinae]